MQLGVKSTLVHGRTHFIDGGFSAWKLTFPGKPTQLHEHFLFSSRTQLCVTFKGSTNCKVGGNARDSTRNRVNFSIFNKTIIEWLSDIYMYETTLHS